jgi:hypothetical protein
VASSGYRAVIIPQPTLAVQVAFLTLIKLTVAPLVRHRMLAILLASALESSTTKAGGSVLYQQGTKSLYEDSKERFELKETFSG